MFFLLHSLASLFQVEALEGRLAPGSVAGGALMDGITRSSGEGIPQVQVHVAPPVATVSGAVARRVPTSALKMAPA